MTKFKSVEEWMKSNPSSDEMLKVLNLINKGAASSVRKAVYENEQFLRKLYRSQAYLEKVGIKANQELVNQIKETKTKIAELKKELPPIAPRAKRVNAEVE